LWIASSITIDESESAGFPRVLFFSYLIHCRPAEERQQ
jgi:hypothetical protein